MAVAEAIKLLGEAERPIIITGTGILWSEASEELQQFVEAGRHPVLHDAAGPRRDSG